jgi:hypothetical protein
MPGLLPAMQTCVRRHARREHEIDRFYVAGLQYHQAADQLGFQRCDPVSLVREPRNPHDQRAIRIEWKGLHIGYVPRNQNRILSRMLDRGEPLMAHINKFNRTEPTWHRVKIRVALVENDVLPERTGNEITQGKFHDC